MTWAGQKQNPVLAFWDRLYQKPTRAEKLLEPYIARLGVRYRFQHRVWNYILDFALPDYSLDIELDGPDHARKTKRDNDRTAWLIKKGWTVVRIDDQEVFEDPVRALNSALERAGLDLRVAG